MRKATIAFVALLSCMTLGCHHNLAHNGCGCGQSCESCGGGGNTCNSCGHCGLHGGGLAMHGDGHGLGLRGHHGDGSGLLAGQHGDGVLGMRSGIPQHVARMPHTGDPQLSGPGGPPTGTYAYPYYTIRAPRDFLLNNPPPLGP
jgi:hypothetical protein